MAYVPGFGAPRRGRAGAAAPVGAKSLPRSFAPAGTYPATPAAGGLKAGCERILAAHGSHIGQLIGQKLDLYPEYGPMARNVVLKAPVGRAPEAIDRRMKALHR